MAHSKFSRRTFLQTIGATFIITGCSPNFKLPTDSSSSMMEATALPSNSNPTSDADRIAQTYLSAWQTDDYKSMYDLLALDSRILLREASRLEQQYRSALTSATVQAVKTHLQSLLYKDNQALVGFEQIWQTALFGDIQAINQMRLTYGEAGWGVVWQPTLILPQLGEGLTLSFLSEQPTRGNIYDRTSHAVAAVGEIITVGVVPQRLENVEATIRHLASITQTDPAIMAEKIFEAQPDWFVPIATINFDTSLHFDELFNNIPGVERRVHQGRIYNDAKVGAHLVGYMGAIPETEQVSYQAKGYTGNEQIGLMGVERWGESYLAGQRGGRLVTLSANQQISSEIATITPKAGESIYLSLDINFQATVERLLGERPGAVVVMDPFTGNIQAMASYPRFTPAVITPGFDVAEWLARYTNETYPLLNRATQGLYPPASIFKIVTMTAALETLGMQPEQRFFCQGHWEGLGPQFSKKCWLETGHGSLSLFDGLTQSCDVVFYEIGLALHHQDPTLLPTWSRHFGLGQPTELVELTELKGVVPDNEWTQATIGQPFFDGDAVNSAIGQGYTLSTPLQVTRLIAAIANGGLLVQPRLATHHGTIAGQKQAFETVKPQAVPLSSTTLNLIQQSLAQVVSGARGTAREAFVGFNNTVAGKTGTAETGYEHPHAWFAGYTPIELPQVAITVILEHAGEGSQEAAPLFRQVAEAYFAWKQTLNQQ